MSEELKSKNKEFIPKVVLFCCERSGCQAVKTAQDSGLIYNNELEIVKMPCSGAIESVDLLKALERADGVFVLACHKEVCQSLTGNLRAEGRINYLHSILEEIGFEKSRLKIHFVAPNGGAKLACALNEAVSELKTLGLNPGRELA